MNRHPDDAAVSQPGFSERPLSLLQDQQIRQHLSAWPPQLSHLLFHRGKSRLSRQILGERVASATSGGTGTAEVELLRSSQGHAICDDHLIIKWDLPVTLEKPLEGAAAPTR